MTTILQALLNMIREINEDYDSRQLPALPPQTPSKHTDSASKHRAADALSDFARLQVCTTPNNAA
jgi:hypothetical protein